MISELGQRKSLFFAFVFLMGSLLVLTGCPKKPGPAPVSQSETGPTGAPTGAGGAGTSAAGGGNLPQTSSGGRGDIGGTAAAPRSGPTTSPSTAAVPSGTVPGAVISPKEFVEASTLRDVHFDFDKYEIRADNAKLLEEASKWLKENPKAQVLVEGHADERGTSEYNLALGERRAKAVRDYLVSLGTETSRISTVSYGEERPVCNEHSEPCWGKNRRGHFLVKP